MGRLIYIANISLDGCVADRDGNFGFTVPTPEVFSTILELVRTPRTHIYGRRMYELMAVWETAHLTPGEPPFSPGLADLERDFAAVWRAADKLVISTTLTTPTTRRTRIVPTFDADAIRSLKRDHDVTVGGPFTAGAMMAAELVDDLHAFVSPIILGGGNRWLPSSLPMRLALVTERRIGNIVHLHYARGS